MPLYITVFEDAAEVALGAPVQEMAVAIGAGSVQSDAIAGTGNRHRRMRLMADVDCFVTWGDDPTATTDGTSGRPMGAENPEYFAINVGQKVAVIERL
jgi:hypothetical protein